MTMNKILVIGNAGTDPEMRYTPNGNAVTSFRLADTLPRMVSSAKRRSGSRLRPGTSLRRPLTSM